MKLTARCTEMKIENKMIAKEAVRKTEDTADKLMLSKREGPKNLKNKLYFFEDIFCFSPL